MRGSLARIRELAPWLLVGANLLTIGCSGNSSSVPCSSLLLVELDVRTDIAGADLVIDEVRWVITGNGMDPMAGTIDTSDPNATPSVEVFGLAPGDYAIDLEATSEDGQSTCRGSAMFDVIAGVSTEVAVLLRCSTGPRFGSVRVNGKLNTCPELINAVVAPLQTSVGNLISVVAKAEDHEGDPIEYAWAADGGTFADPSAVATFYTCEEVGDHQITISVTDDGFEYCLDSWTVDIRCVDDGGTGGTGGNGASGGAGGTGGIGGAGGIGGGMGGHGGGGGIGGIGGAGGHGGIGGIGGHGGIGGVGGGGGTGGDGGTSGGGGTGGRGGTGGHGGIGGQGGIGGDGGDGGQGGDGGTDQGMCEVTVSLTSS